MKRRWTPEQKAALAKNIQTWKPWTYSTGPKTPEGKAIVARNSFKGGKRPAQRQEAKAFKAVVQASATLIADVTANL